MRRHEIRARQAAQGGEELATQSDILAMMTLNSSYSHPKRRIKFLISIAPCGAGELLCHPRDIVLQEVKGHCICHILPPPLTVGGPSDRQLQIYWQKVTVKAAHQVIIILFLAFLDVALPSPALRQCIPHQACVYTPLPEV